MVFACVHFFQDILLGSVRTSSYVYEESSVDHRTALGVIEARALSVLKIVRQARLILLVLTTKFDLQDLSHGKSGLTSLLSCPVPKSSRRIPGIR